MARKAVNNASAPFDFDTFAASTLADQPERLRVWTNPGQNDLSAPLPICGRGQAVPARNGCDPASDSAHVISSMGDQVLSGRMDGPRSSGAEDLALSGPEGAGDPSDGPAGGLDAREMAGDVGEKRVMVRPNRGARPRSAEETIWEQFCEDCATNARPGFNFLLVWLWGNKPIRPFFNRVEAWSEWVDAEQCIEELGEFVRLWRLMKDGEAWLESNLEHPKFDERAEAVADRIRRATSKGDRLRAALSCDFEELMALFDLFEKGVK